MRSTAPRRTTIATLAAGLILLLSLQLSAAPAEWTHDDAAHLLRRAGFGGTPEQINRLHAMGKAAAIDYLLDNLTRPPAEPAFAKVELPAFEIKPPPDDKQAANQQRRQDIGRLRTWWVDRMCRSDKPLEEKMTLFWHGLFCSGFMEVREPTFMAQQNELFRKEALGNYKKLTHAIIHDPAMLRYLNADQNIKGKPNENLARELMELFTMGEGNGYTETDIKEVARALTGLAVNNRTGATFRGNRHDDGRKTIFGKTGDFKPDDVVELIFDQPQPAQYLARRLWLFFASPEPSNADLVPIIEALRRNNYELKPALRALFISQSFYSDKVKFSLIRSPTELVAGTVRQLEMQLGPQALQFATQSLNRMGQELLQPPNVRGWPGGEHWITSATLYTRYNICSMLVAGQGGKRQNFNQVSAEKLFKLPQDAAPLQVVDAAIARFLQRPLPQAKKTALLEALGDTPLRPGARDTDRRVQQMLGLLMSTPEYQMH